MKKQYQIIISLFMGFLFLFCGCTSAPPSDPSDELISNTWILYGRNNEKNGTLTFSNEHIIFNADINESNPFTLNEEYIIEDKKITIVSENYGILSMEYSISGNELTLTYLGKNIVLKKQNKF